MIEIDDMRSFVEVVEAGGFSRAARRLGLSKSIISRRIAKLEDELGTRLLNRTTRGIAPTEAGLDFKIRSERIIGELEEAREVMANHRGGVVGRLRLTAPVTFGTRHVAPLLAALAERHPKLEIDLSLSDRKVDLISEGYDIAIRLGTLADSTLIARRITTVRSIVVASPDYLAEYGFPARPENLLQHQCIGYAGRAATDWTFRVGRKWLTVRPRTRLVSDNGEAILRWAIAGCGIAEIPMFLLDEAIERQLLIPLLSDFELPASGLHVLRPPGANVPGKVRALIDAMVDNFGGTPVWDRCMMAYAEAEQEQARAAALTA